ncbi:MAG: cyclic nucleotide-binding domain-containing protein, partial [Anaerolineae bacterium]
PFERGSMYPDTPAQELYQKLKTMLRASPTLVELTDEQITQLAAQARFEEHKHGATIIKQGNPAESFYFIVDGQVRVVDARKKPARLLNYMGEGEFLGERGLLLKKPRSATVDVAVDAIIARFNRQTWQWLLDIAPILREHFEALEKEYEQHAQIPFPGRQTDEVTIIKIRRHILVIIVRLPGPLFLLLLGLVVGWLLNDLTLFTPAINGGLMGLFAALSLVWAVYELIEWYNDDFIVSTKRIIHIERTLFGGSHREETPLTQVLDVGVSTENFFTRVFGYSTVNIKSAGIGTIRFDGINEGDRVKEIIFEQIRQAKERVEAGDISAIRKSLAGEIGWAGGPLEAQPLEVVDIGTQKKKRELPALIRYYLPNFREETPDGVTWRKHYLIWLRNVWLPGLVGLAGLYFLAASIFTLPPFSKFETRTTIILAVVQLIILVWYTYMHDDWHKDTYKVTGTQIIHQDSTAFRLRGEEIHETTFGNVQNINYDIPNFLSRIFQIGDVVIKTATVGEPFVFENIYFPRDVQQEIFGRWVAFKENERQKERAHDETRFTTWLGEYHKMLSEQSRSR